MFLLVRSALCIALVVGALPERPSVPTTAAFGTVAADAGGLALASVDRFCRRDPRRCADAADSVRPLSGARI